MLRGRSSIAARLPRNEQNHQQQLQQQLQHQQQQQIKDMQAEILELRRKLAEADGEIDDLTQE